MKRFLLFWALVIVVSGLLGLRGDNQPDLHVDQAPAFACIGTDCP